MFMLIWLLHIMNQSEEYENIPEPKQISPKIINNKIKKNYIIKMPRKKCVVKQKSSNMTRDEIVEGHMEICPREAESIKKFHTDFFKFRDKTHNNSSIILDAVDKVNDLTLNGGWWEPPVGEEAPKISDIYDKLTQRPDFQSACTRTEMVTPYIFGGKLEKRLYAMDPSFIEDQYPLSAFPPIKPTDWSGS